MGKKPETVTDRDSFDAILADHKNSSHHFEEVDGSWRTWRELSAEGKLAYVALDAARDDVSFERFAAAVREMLGGDAATREQACLRLLLRSEMDLLALERLLPETSDLAGYGRPLAPHFKELIQDLSAPPTPPSPRPPSLTPARRGPDMDMDR
jgi:hypothetical protein